VTEIVMYSCAGVFVGERQPASWRSETPWQRRG
jgi:hypothetical protein